MPQERLPVRKIREVIRLHHEAELSNRAIARVCKVSNSTVGEYLVRAEQADLGWPLPEGLDDAVLYQRLFPEKNKIVQRMDKKWWSSSKNGIPITSIRKGP